MEQRIYIHGIIGSDVTAEAVKSEFDNAIENKVDTITVDIQSHGGDLHTGRAILGFMDRAKTLGITVKTEVFSYAYSMGAAIFQGATKGQRFIGEFGELMNHQAMTGVYGNADEMREMSSKLDDATANLATVILRNDKAKENEAEIMDALKSEKFINANDAIRLGLADAEIEKSKAVAINQNNIKMSENKEAKTLLDEIKSWFTGVKAEAAPQATEETAEQLKEKITALEGELATLKSEKEAKDAEVATLTTEVEALNTLKTGFEAKIKEVENLIAGEKSPENGKKPEGKEVPEFLKGESVSDKMKRLDAENRKRYNS